MSSEFSANSRKQVIDRDHDQYLDHRKRRRNRTTQSCLNCHGSKRMCDRKRPACGRCVKLGLFGTCLYEVDDVNQRCDTDRDVIAYLKSRIAELEGFIREYKKKAHSRWGIDTHDVTDYNEQRGSSYHGDRDNEVEFRKQSIQRARHNVSPTSGASTSTATSPMISEPSSPSSFCGGPIFLTNTESNCNANRVAMAISTDTYLDLMTHKEPSDVNDSPQSSLPVADSSRRADFASTEIDISRQCQCMKKSSAYSVILELAPHIHKAFNALHALPEHAFPLYEEPCEYFEHLKSLDSATLALINIISNCLTSPSSNFSSSLSPYVMNSSSSLSSIPGDVVRPPFYSGQIWPSFSLTNMNTTLPTLMPALSHFAIQRDGSKVSHPSELGSRGTKMGESSVHEADRLMSWEPITYDLDRSRTISL